MIRVLVVGNSHMIALRDGWDAMRKDFPGLDLRFFGAPGGVFQKLQIDDGMNFGCVEGVDLDAKHLAMLRRTAGASAVNLLQADAVIHVGFASYHGSIAQIIASFDIDGVSRFGQRARLSLYAFQDICKSIAQKALPNSAWDGRKIPALAFVPSPRPSVDCEAGTLPVYDGWKQLTGRGSEVSRAVDLFMDHVEAAFASRSIILVRQPASTLAECGLTRREFSRDSVNYYGVAHDAEDYFHMNASYGKLHLSAAFEALGLV